MAFKSFSQYQADKNGEFFVLPNDGDYADVIFLYRSVEDVLVADVHYINTSSYKGYVHCCGVGCPACNYGERGIRLDHKIFIPLYNIQKNKIEYWDRTTFFESILQKSVFGPYPIPWETVFRITRRGESGSRDTKYDILPVGRNTVMTYDKILSDFHITFPDGYSVICKEMPAHEMSAALSARSANADMPDYGYVPVPRGSSEATVPNVTVATPQYSAPPEVAPPIEAAPMTEYRIESVDGVSTIAPVSVPEQNLPEADDSTDSLDDVHF